MLKATKKLLSLGLALAMLLSLMPAGTAVIAQGAGDTTLSDLYYTFNGATQTIELTPDNADSNLQENRYSVTLPYITKTFSSDRMPQVGAAAATGGATLSITPITSFPGTAKITVRSPDGTAARDYYVRFTFKPGNIGPVTNKIGTQTYLAYNDLQPLSLTELRKVYADEGSNWANYCQSFVDRYVSGFLDAGTSTYKLPSDAATYTGTGEFISDYYGSGNKWFTMWIAKGTTSGDTSSFFNGASWIATGNDDRSKAYMTESHNDAISFTIDRDATVWVASQNATATNFQANGWTKSNAGYKLYHGDASSFTNFFTHDFKAGDMVNIPSQGAAPSRMYIPLIVWGAPGTGDAALSSLTATYGGADHDIPIVPGQTTYNIKVTSMPVIHAGLSDPDAESDIVQGTGMPGAATVTVVSGTVTTVYTINYTLEGQEIIYADKSDTTGASGVAYVKYSTTYPKVPVAGDFSSSSPENVPNAEGFCWDFGDGHGSVNITRNYTNYGGDPAPFIRNEGRGSGSSQYMYIKMDLSSLNPEQAVQQALLSFNLSGGSVMTYNGYNKSLYVDVYEVPETNWITGTGVGEASWGGNAPSKIIRSEMSLFPLVDSAGGLVSGDVTVPYPLTAMSAPDFASSNLPDIAGAAYSKRLATVNAGTMATGADYGTITADVTQSVRDKIAAGKTTATFKLAVTPYIYGYAVPSGTMNNMYVNMATDGTARPKLTVTGAEDTGYASAENKLAYVAIGDKSYYTSGNRTYEPGKTPIDLAESFNAENMSEQDFNLYTAALTDGKVGLNAVAKDANATVSINGAEATQDSQYALITPVRGAAEAQVAVTAQNGETLTYNLRFNIIDYQASTDSSLSALAYTHPELGTKGVALQAGVTGYNAELPYGLSAELPQVTGVPNNSYAAIINTVQPAAIPGDGTITVRAESGAETTYTIHFTRSATPPEPGVGTVTGLKYRGADAADPFMAVTGVQATQPIDIFNDNVNYPTQADKIAAVRNADINLYKNDNLRVYSDRTPSTGGGSGGSSSSAIGSHMEFAFVVNGEDATSPEFLSPNVTHILTKNDEKGKTDLIPDAYTFTIDKPATVYIAWGNKATPSANILSYNWQLDETGLKVSRSAVGTFRYTEGESADGQYYAVPNGGTNSYTGIYSKHYAAGANVSIPSTGGGSSGLVVFIIWDTVAKQTITGLTLNASSNLRQTEGATETVTFRAIATPSVDVDRSTIEWYINGVKQSATGANFSYKPTEIGSYVVSVKVAGNESATVDSKTIVVKSEIAAGDISGDGEITVSDVIMAAEIAVGNPDYTADQIARANVSDKSDATVDISDVVLIAEFAVGDRDSFPVD